MNFKKISGFRRASRGGALLHLFVALALLAFLILSTARASLIANGGFESPVVLVGGHFAIPTSWTFGDGGIIIRPPIDAPYPSPPPGGDQYELLSAGGILAQAFSIPAGAGGVYQLTWVDNTLADKDARYNAYVMSGPIPTPAEISAGFVPPIIVRSNFDPFHGNLTVWNTRSLSMTLDAGDYFVLFSNANSLGDKPFGGGTRGAEDTYYALDNVVLAKPISISCPPSLSVECPAVPPAATNISTFIAQGGTVNANTNCLPVTLTFTETIANDCPKIITRAYQLVDACGAHAECSQIITVNDTTKPIIGDAPPDLSLECDGTTPPLISPTATDNCDPSPEVILSEEITYSCANAYTLVRSWYARDHCGNISERTVRQTIKVHDTTPPVLALQMISATNLFPTLNMAYDSGLGGEVTFTAFGAKIRSFRLGNFTGAVIPPPLGNTLTFSIGATATFDFSSDGGTTWHSYTAPSSMTMQLTHTSDADDTATFEIELLAQDISHGTLPSELRLRESPSLRSTGSVTIRTTAEGYEFTSLLDLRLELTLNNGVTWASATDALHLTAVPSLDRSVEIGDTDATAAAYALQPSFIDACEGVVAPLPPDVTTVADGSCATGAGVERRWRAKDRCNNLSAEFVQRITLMDTTPPRITCPDNIMIFTGPFTPVDFTATATDLADDAPIITYDHPQHGTFPMGTNVVTCWARDHCGNESQCSFTVIVSTVGCTPTLQAYVKTLDGHLTGFEDGFGESLALDGDTMVVGAPEERGGGATGGGSISMLGRNSSGEWLHQAGFFTAVGTSGTLFGASVAISGNTVVAGAPGLFGGRVYVFVRDASGNWAPQGDSFTASNTEPGDKFGGSVAISGDTMVVGAVGEASGNRDPSNNGAPLAGAAYVFVRDAGGSWTQRAYLKASNAEGGDEFGCSVAIVGDTIVIGAPREGSNFAGVQNTSIDTLEQDNNSFFEAGAAYVFGRDTDGGWVQQAYLKSSRPTFGAFSVAPGGNFGRSVAVSGERLVVGVPYDESSCGAAEVFVRTAGLWRREARIASPLRGTQFGTSVGISGNSVVIGYPWDASSNGDPLDTRAPGSGAAFTYIHSGSEWIRQGYLKASNPDAGDGFGVSVAISGNTAVVGAPSEDSNCPLVQNVSGITPEQRDNSATDSGAAYVFTIADSPCASDDTFFVPIGGELTIPIGTLLGNDAHSRGRTISVSAHDAATARGLIISDVGSPATALHLPPPPPGAEDTFTYHITDGTTEVVGTVHLLPVAIPSAPPNKLTLLPHPPPGGGMTFPFTAPDAGIYALERKIFSIPGTNSIEIPWIEVGRASATGPGVTTFVDAPLPIGGLYRVRWVP